ncbi:MAG: threonine synthase [Calditrichia bacterium]
MEPYYYQCSRCHQNFTAGEIEKESLYLCPDCGRTAPNEPLEGVLEIFYPYHQIAKNFSLDKLLNLPAGQIWRYPMLWPVNFNSIEPRNRKAIFERVTLPANKLIHHHFSGVDVLLWDETNNPTFSYKDRASILVALKAIEQGFNKISVASTGNAGSSMAGIAARLGLQAHVWVPHTIPEAKLLQIMGYGAKVHLVHGDYDTAFDLCLEISPRQKWFNRNTALNPLTIEGKKSAAFDIFIQMRGSIPKYIFVPAGDGVILAGIYKGFKDLQELGFIKSLPRLIAVQSRGSDAICRYLATGKFTFQPPETIAESISVGAPRNLYLAARAVKESGGFAVAVEDGEIVEAQKQISHETGILPEPAAAATLAGLKKAKERLEFHASEKVLLLMTGNALKDLNSLKRLYRKPDELTPTIWRDRYLEP